VNDPVRQAFEEVCFPNFGVVSGYTLGRNNKGEYADGTVEDHWQTFQEGWEEAMNYLKQKDNLCYTDIVSTGGMDPR
jgi:hypothetical protein